MPHGEHRRRTAALDSKNIKDLFLAYRHELRIYLTRKLRDADLAADLTQETFLRFAEHSRGNPAAVITHERSYLYRTAHNLAIDHLRKRQRERTDTAAPDILDALIDESPLADRVAGGRDDLEAVGRALSELPDRAQQVFRLTRIEGLTYRETAARLKISDSSVQKHLARAVLHVMRRLRDE